MSNFSELWDKSGKFRNLFVLNHVVDPRKQTIDLAFAEAQWEERYPRLKWDLCGVDGCIDLICKGQPCARHGGKLPTWKWKAGILYRFVKDGQMVKSIKRAQGKEYGYYYRKYADYVAESLYGRIPDGYTAATLDGNPFNFVRTNVIVMTVVSKACVDSGLITPAKALALDKDVAAFCEREFTRGRKSKLSKFKGGGWAYTLEMIGDACGIPKKEKWRRRTRRSEHIMAELTRQGVDPNDFVSVVEFCGCLGGNPRVEGEDLQRSRRRARG